MSGSSGTPMNFPTLLGVYLAVNAISDAYLLADGPDCTLYKAHFIHGRHDLNSTLLALSGRHRIAFTNVCSRGVVKEHDEILRGLIKTLDDLKESSLILVTALPMCSITGVDYGRVIRSLAGSLSKPAMDIPPDSLVGDWLDGYAQTFAALARGIKFSRGRRRKECAAVVGYFMDRNEADHLANLTEIRRMLKALSLETVSVWLDGGDVASLKRAEEAEFIVSLPYGRAAARRLAKATGARLIETELPFGIPKTSRFLRDVGKAVRKAKKAEAFIDSELSRVIPRLKRIVPHLFLHKKTAFMGDPYLLGGILDIAEDLGMSVEGAIVHGRRSHGNGTPSDTAPSNDHHPHPAGWGKTLRGPILHEPPSDSKQVRRLINAPLDLFISTSSERKWPHLQARTMEFGFPSYHHHTLYERPFLGFNGCLAFVDRMADRLSTANARAGRNG